MTDYILNGLLVGTLGLVLLRILEPARARTRLVVCLGSILLIALPWFWLGKWLSFAWSSHTRISMPGQIIEQTLQPIYAGVVSNQTHSILDYWYFIVPVAIGILAFAFVSIRQYQQVTNWRRMGKVSRDLTERLGMRIPVWVVPGESLAVATLFGSREIWIGGALVSHPKLDVALTHEEMHHKLGHPALVWLLTLVRCLCWWHPLVWVFVARARNEIEIECDEHCAATLGRQSYQRDLATLLLDVKYVPLGAAFGGRGNVNVARIKRLANSLVMGHSRLVAAYFTMALGVFGFVAVHAETGAEVKREHQGWNVRYENTPLEEALDQIAKMSGIDIYLDPQLNVPAVNFEASKIQSWRPLIDGVTNQYADVHWAERGGVLFVGSHDSLRDQTWLPNAILLRGHGVGVFDKQNTSTGPSKSAVRIDVKYEERVSDSDVDNYEMAILVDLKNPAALRQGDIHISFDGTTSDEEIAVSFYKVTSDSSLKEVGKAKMPLQYEETKDFEWINVDGVDYRMWLSLSHPAR